MGKITVRMVYTTTLNIEDVQCMEFVFPSLSLTDVKVSVFFLKSGFSCVFIGCQQYFLCCMPELVKLIYGIDIQFGGFGLGT